MTFPRRIATGSEAWDAWHGRFPDLPLPNEFALQWTLNRLVELRQHPDPSSLPAASRQGLRDWVSDWSKQFGKDQRRPPEGLDIAGLLSAVSAVAGIPMLGIAPPIGVGLIAASVAGYGRKEVRRAILNKREKLAREVQDVIDELDKVLR